MRYQEVLLCSSQCRFFSTTSEVDIFLCKKVDKKFRGEESLKWANGFPDFCKLPTDNISDIADEIALEWWGKYGTKPTDGEEYRELVHIISDRLIKGKIIKYES